MTSAQQTWADAMLAAALLAVDPGLGGAVVRAGAGPVRDAWTGTLKALQGDGAPWRRLPPGAEDDRLLGGMDLAAVLASGQRVMQRGLLAEADGGVLVAPMAERMASGTAARLASALDAGMVRLERDGLSETHAARFVLIALDEGVADERAPDAIAERLAFHIDLHGIGPRDAQTISASAEDIAEARAALAQGAGPDDEAIQAICGAAAALGVASLRAPMMAVRAASALAALEGRTEIEADDLATAARLVLAPRATRRPPMETPEAEAQPEPAEEPSPDEAEAADRTEPVALEDRILEAIAAALPDGIEAIWAARGPGVRSARSPAGVAGSKLKAATRGRRLGSRPGRPAGASALDLVETLKAAAPWQKVRGAVGRLAIRRDDFRVRRYEQRTGTTVIFVVDASGSAALQRLAETKGAVELLLAEAYVRRTQVALIAFRKEAAEVLLPPTRSLARARRELGALAGGGATPLASALEAGTALAVAERVKGQRPILIVMTDGRGNIALDGGAFRTRAEQDALIAARRIKALGLSAALIDISARPRGEGQKLAEAMGADFAALPHVEAGRLTSVVRALEA